MFKYLVPFENPSFFTDLLRNSIACKSFSTSVIVGKVTDALVVNIPEQINIPRPILDTKDSGIALPSEKLKASMNGEVPSNSGVLGL